MHHLTSVVALAGAAGASTIDLGSKQTAMTESLLQKARPYKKNAAGAGSRRRLDQNFQIDVSYSVLFSRCVDIKLLDDDLFDENVIEYTKAGSLISTKSYALFHVCQGDDCYYESEDDLFIVDLATYVKVRVPMNYFYNISTHKLIYWTSSSSSIVSSIIRMWLRTMPI